MTTITEMPAGTTHVLNELAKDGPFYDFIKVDDSNCYSWCGNHWRLDCNTLQHLNLYTPIGELQDLASQELAQAEDEAFNNVRIQYDRID